MRSLLFTVLLLTSSTGLFAQLSFIKEAYQKFEYKIPMRDGVKLHTAVYVPKDASAQ
ncbi:MAG: hypothetical protein H7Y12_07590, partial [Sphingobacteriaceae bacterium]|nr:hypothetical protein [Cytophagaceae bacterium]